MAMLEFFFRHYQPWVERFVFFDDGSTDGSREYLRSKPNVEVRPFRYADPDSFESSRKVVFHHCWKESQGLADWVIVLDVDEFLYHPSLDEYLRHCEHQGITCIPALGFEMITNTFPGSGESLARSRTRGVPSPWYCKLGMFNPDAMESVAFSGGSHSARMTGRVVLPKRDELLLLHYKKLGLDYLVARSAALETRRISRSRDLARGLSRHWGLPRKCLERQQIELRWQAINVTGRGTEPWRDYPHAVWWRSAHDPSCRSSGWTRFWKRQGNSIRKRLGRLIARMRRL